MSLHYLISRLLWIFQGLDTETPRANILDRSSSICTTSARATLAPLRSAPLPCCAQRTTDRKEAVERRETSSRTLVVLLLPPGANGNNQRACRPERVPLALANRHWPRQLANGPGQCPLPQRIVHQPITTCAAILRCCNS